MSSKLSEDPLCIPKSPLLTRPPTLKQVDADHHTVLLGNILTSKVPQEEELLG